MSSNTHIHRMHCVVEENVRTKKLILSHDEPVLLFLNPEKEETKILGSFKSQKKASAGRISYFEPGVKAVSQLLSYICQDVRGAV